MTKKKVAIIASIVIAVILLIAGVSYAYYSATVTENNKTETVIKTDKLTLVFTGTNEITTGDNMIPGDSFTKTFTVENTSDIDTKYNIYMENVTNEFNEDLVYVLSDEDGVVVEETPLPVTNAGKSYLISDIEIASKELKTYTLKIEYKYLDTPQNNYQGATFRGTVGVDANKIENVLMPDISDMTLCSNNANINTTKLCRRAINLHSETCDWTDTTYYCLADYATGDEIIYGNCGSNDTLSAGDAFDCDVNGDGDYSEETERFYYVSDMNENTSVLIYYNNIEKTIPSNTSKSAYDLNYSSTEYHGPQTAITQLPTIEDWNTTLVSSTRNILDDNNMVRVNNFSYGNKAARLLTYEEVKDACFDENTTITDAKTTGSLSKKCKYLLENTRYSNTNLTVGYWLETVHSSNSLHAWNVFGNYNHIGNRNIDFSDMSAVRPAIEVPKSQIEL